MLTPEEEARAWARLEPRLAALWNDVFTKDDEPYTSIVVPSVTMPDADLERQPGVLFFEETLLFLLIRLRNPHARIVYLTSTPVPPPIVDYYLHFLAGIPASHAAQRLTMLSAYDPSPRPLSAKILERPRLLERIRAAVPDRTRAYLTVLRSTPLERRLSVQLDVPLNGADPALDERFTRSGARRLLREAGFEVPAGREDIRTEAQLVEAMAALGAERPGLRRALLRLNHAQWETGHAVVPMPETPSPAACRAALDSMTSAVPGDGVDVWLERMGAEGAALEELIEPRTCVPVSVQLRITPIGRVTVTSTHDDLLGGHEGLSARGCRFPASEPYRRELHEAGLRIGRRLASEGLASRVSVEFLACPEGGRWRLLGADVNLGFGGSTRPLLALRFLTGGSFDPEAGVFLAPSGRPKCYRATDHLESPAYRGLLPEDVIETLTMNGLNYSPQRETGALAFLLGGVSSLGRLGLVAIGNDPADADRVFRVTVEALDREAARA